MAPARWGLALPPGDFLLLATLVWQAGGDFLAADGRRATLDEAAALAGVRAFAELLVRAQVAPPPPPPGSPPAQYQADATGLRYGLARIALALAALAPDLPTLRSPTLKLAPVPLGKVPVRAVWVRTMVAVHARTRQPERALAALPLLVEQLQQRALLPTTRPAAAGLSQAQLGLPEDTVRAGLESLESGRAWTLDAELTDLIVTQVVAAVLFGAAPEAAARAAAQAITARLPGRSGPPR